jgi:phosphinothricin acetyltransferase
VDVTVYVAENARRTGVGQGLYRVLKEILRAQGYASAFAGIALPNPGSVGLHEAAGFNHLGIYRRVGHKLGQWRDVGWWQMDLGKAVDDSSEPVPLDQLNLPEFWV